MTSSRRKWLSLAIGGSFFVGAFTASANLSQVLPELSGLERGAIFSLRDDAVNLYLSGDAYIKGDLDAARNWKTSLNGNPTIDGGLYYPSVGILKILASTTVPGMRFRNQDSLLNNGGNEAISGSNNFFARAPAGSYTTVHLSDSQSMTVAGAPGETVVLNLRNFRLAENATFTLQG
jgi:hypothetical protein